MKNEDVLKEFLFDCTMRKLSERTLKGYKNNKFNYETDYLLLLQKGRKLTVETIERIVLEAGLNVGVRAEVRISPHTCRHYYAQAQLRNGCDLFSLSRLLVISI